MDTLVAVVHVPVACAAARHRTGACALALRGAGGGQFPHLRQAALPAAALHLWHAYLATKTALPLMRAMVLEYTEDPNTYDLDDQYLFGDAFLVAPVYSPTGQRTVYLPAGKWYHYWTAPSLLGPATLHVEPDLEELPLYVRSDSIIPMGPDMSYVGERPFDPITLDIWLEDEAECTLFDDSDGDDQANREVPRPATNRADRAGGERIAQAVRGQVQPRRPAVQRMILDGAPVPQVARISTNWSTPVGLVLRCSSFTLYVKFTALGSRSLLTLRV